MCSQHVSAGVRDWGCCRGGRCNGGCRGAWEADAAGAVKRIVVVPGLLLGHGGHVLHADVGGVVELLGAKIGLPVHVVLDVVAVAASAQVGHDDEHERAVVEHEGPLHDGRVAPVLGVGALRVRLAHERTIAHHQDDGDARPHDLHDGTHEEVADAVVSVVYEERQAVCADVREDEDDKQDNKHRVRSRVLPVVLQTGRHQDAQAANDAEGNRQGVHRGDKPVERHREVVLLGRPQVVVLDDGPHKEDAHHCRAADEDGLQVCCRNVREIDNVVRHLVVVRVQDRSSLGKPADHQRHKHRPPSRQREQREDPRMLWFHVRKLQ